jgi:hypothetical protein
MTAQKIIFSRHLGFFGKVFPSNLRLTSCLKQLQKKEREKILETLRAMLKKLIVFRHLGSIHHLWRI